MAQTTRNCRNGSIMPAANSMKSVFRRSQRWNLLHSPTDSSSAQGCCGPHRRSTTLSQAHGHSPQVCNSATAVCACEQTSVTVSLNSTARTSWASPIRASPAPMPHIWHRLLPWDAPLWIQNASPYRPISGAHGAHSSGISATTRKSTTR